MKSNSVEEHVSEIILAIKINEKEQATEKDIHDRAEIHNSALVSGCSYYGTTEWELFNSRRGS